MRHNGTMALWEVKCRAADVTSSSLDEVSDASVASTAAFRRSDRGEERKETSSWYVVESLSAVSSTTRTSCVSSAVMVIWILDVVWWGQEKDIIDKVSRTLKY